jgi:hypothetical protein
MTASFTIRATELFCWSANVVSRSWSSASKREWIERGGSLFGGRRIMLHFDSFWFIYQPYMRPCQGTSQNVVDSRPWSHSALEDLLENLKHDPWWGSRQRRGDLTLP